MNNAGEPLSSQDVLERVFHASLREQEERGMEETLTIAFETGPLREFSRNPFRQYFIDLVRIIYEDERILYENWRRGRRNNVTALHFAAFLGLTHLCEGLIQNFRYDVNAPCSRDGTNALHLATREYNISTVRTLIDLGAYVNSRGHLQATPLHIAVMRGYEALARLLISRGANTETSCYYGTPLQCAAVASEYGTMEILLNNNVDVNSTSSNCSRTALHLAVEQNSMGCLWLLLTAEPNVSTKACGTTPLCRAASQGTAEMVLYLLNAGADPNAEDTYDSTPLENAVRARKLASAVILHPVTITYATWNLAQVIDYIHSPEYLAQRKRRKEVVFDIATDFGNEELRNSRYFEAVRWYNAAIGANPNNERVYLNRSIAYVNLSQGSEALLDAQVVVRLNKFSVEAHLAKAVAWRLLQDNHKALQCLDTASRLDPTNIHIRVGIELIRRGMLPREDRRE